MKKPIFLILIPVLLALPCSAFSFDGPLQVRNQFPIFLPINQPFLEQASTQTSFSLSLSHSSVFVVKESAQWTSNLDIELTELNIRFKKDLPGLFELGLDVPIERATAGFMDRPLAWYHRAFGFGDYGRSTRPRNSFLYDIRKNGQPVIEGENDRTGFGDVRLTFKRKLIECGPIVSILADLEPPTGNPRIGYGSGSLDAGLALLLDYDLSPEARLYANAGAIVPGHLKAHQTIELRNFYYAGTGIEYLYSPDLGLIAQLLVQTSPFPQTGISQIDTAGILLVLGGRYYVGKRSFELSLTEDPNTSGAPDFIVNLSYRQRF